MIAIDGTIYLVRCKVVAQTVTESTLNASRIWWIAMDRQCIISEEAPREFRHLECGLEPSQLVVQEVLNLIVFPGSGTPPGPSNEFWMSAA